MDARLAAQGLSRLADHGRGPTGPSSTSRRSITRTPIITPSPRRSRSSASLDEVDPEILRVYEKLGIPIEEQKVLAGVEGARKVAVDAVFDSVSVATTFREELKKAGRHLPLDLRGDPRISRPGPASGSARSCRSATITSPASTARSSPTAPSSTSPRACAARWSSRTYFRINAENTGQFERTLIVADKGSYVSYLEGCTAPMRDENQLHAAVVELVALDDAEIKYSTVQNWYPGDAEGKGGIYNFVTKRGDVRRASARKVSLDPGRDRQRDHLEISVLRAQGRGQRRRILFGRGDQQLPAGRYRHQDDPHRREQPLDDRLQGHQRGQVEQHLSRPGAGRRRRRECPQLHPVRFSCCSAPNAARTPCPISRSATPPPQIEHEATTSQDQRRPAVLRDAARPRRRRKRSR